MLTINGLFTTGEMYSGGSLFWINVQGILNPYSTQQTGIFTLGMTLSTGSYTSNVDGITSSVGIMTCTVATSPTKVNQNGKLIVSFVAPEFPSGSSIQIQTSSVYWSEGQPPQQSGD